MFYFTKKNTKKFHMGYKTFDRYQYGHHFVFANHKTHCSFFLSLKLVNSVQRHQRQSESETLWPSARFVWEHLVCGINCLADGIQCCPLHYFVPHEFYITGVLNPTILLRKNCIFVGYFRYESNDVTQELLLTSWCGHHETTFTAPVFVILDI
jgi:hypothetical protein